MAFEDKSEAKNIFSGYTILDCKNIVFISEVNPHFDTVWVTDGHCSCSLYSEPYDPVLAAEKLRKKFTKPKYRKKGWSEDRVEREVERILKTSKIEGGLSSLLFQCIQTYTKTIGMCQMHVGWYSGDQNEEGISIYERLDFPINTNIEKANEIYENVLYTFKYQST